jgi:AGCS family alanine or glycine:cation symporter
MKEIGDFLAAVSNFIWDLPLLILFMGGGFFFLIYSRFLPFRYLAHAINVLRGKYDDPNDPGHISHFQALSGALAATVGMGNISGVALALVAGGPGVMFWMWVSAFVGMATKFFTCTLAVMYRGQDSSGELQGGPMYVIREGLGKKWMPLAVMFCVAGFLGATPIFQANQMVDVIGQVVLTPMNISIESYSVRLIIGLLMAFLAGLVIIGGIQRIGLVASKLVPAMVVVYSLCVIAILLLNVDQILPSFELILSEAFKPTAIAGGALLALIIEGAKRASFSNEAGVGTAPMMHGATKTKEPVREGLVAMLGPAIDTLVVCTMTGLCIIVTGLWKTGGSDGIALTAQAFEMSLGNVGSVGLVFSVLIFGFTTILGMAFYGKQCFVFLAGHKYAHFFNYWYVIIIVVGAMVSLDVVVNIIFIGFGLMAIPTMTSALILAPKVLAASKEYFISMNKSKQVKDL